MPEAIFVGSDVLRCYPKSRDRTMLAMSSIAIRATTSPRSVNSQSSPSRSYESAEISSEDPSAFINR